MKLSSSTFKEGGIIPSRYTCEGANVSPPLEITGAPTAAKCFVLIMDDPDVPPHVRSDRCWIHWTLFNIPPATHHFNEGAHPPGTPGRTTFGHKKYGGPCPPDREHRYFFKLYALDQLLDLEEGADKKAIEQAMEGHILASAELMGRYEKGKNY